MITEVGPAPGRGPTRRGPLPGRGGAADTSPARVRAGGPVTGRQGRAGAITATLGTNLRSIEAAFRSFRRGRELIRSLNYG